MEKIDGKYEMIIDGLVQQSNDGKHLGLLFEGIWR